MTTDSSRRDLAIASACLAVAVAFIVAALVQDLGSTMFVSVPVAVVSLLYIGYLRRKRG